MSPPRAKPLRRSGDKIMERKEYQLELEEGWLTNRPLPKPKAKGGIIYSTIDEETIFIDGQSFSIAYDDTDHFSFVCDGCHHIVEVLQVKFVTNCADDQKFALFFYLGCPQCGATGQRKIYFGTMDAFCQYVFMDNNKLLVYGRSGKPDRSVSFTPGKEEELT